MCILFTDMAMVRGAQLVLDIVVFVLTVWKSLQLRTHGYSNLVDIFMRDGKSSHRFLMS